jgi:cellulose synthase/poly-beta-1,6-N-acetylglucosamine synthase-like glycosyltransferase
VTAIEVLFWVCCLLTLHTYLLYPVFLFGASSAVQVWRDWRYLRTREERRRVVPAEPVEPPAVSLIIPAHNEERRLPDKFANLRALDYPSERLNVLFASDGSTDGTNALLRAAEGGHVEVLYLPARFGKAGAINQAVVRARDGILVFSDAATLFRPDAVKKLVRHFAEPRVGVVCGALRFEASVESRQTEGVYWRYESMLRLMESRLGVTLTASGAIYAVRRECFVPFPPDTLVEDLLVPVNARRAGFRVVYDPDAVATDFAPPTVSGEFARRVRIATGSFGALGEILRGPVDPLTAFAFFSHKLLRWILPFLLVGMLLASAFLWEQPVYRLLFVSQVVFYAWAGLGCVFRRRVQRIRYALVAYYLLAIHLAFLVGFMRFVTGHRGAEWRRAS